MTIKRVPIRGDTLVTGKRIVLEVNADVVSIHIHCGDPYEGQVLFEDLDERFKRGEMVGIHSSQKIK